MAFVPTDLDSIIAHWRGEDIPSGTPDPLNWDDVVSAWRLSASGTARPTYSGTAIGGLPGLDFDGTSDFMTTTSTKLLTNNIQVAIVCNLTSQSTSRGLISITPSSVPNYATALVAIDPYAGIFYQYSQEGYEAYLPVMTGGVNTVVRTAKCPYTNSGVWLNGARCRNGGSGMSDLASLVTMTCYLHLGAGSSSVQRFLGPMCEMVIWTEPTQGNHYLYVEGFLAHKYNITLPTWHPFYAAAPTSGPSSGGSLITGIKNKGIRVS